MPTDLERAITLLGLLYRPTPHMLEALQVKPLEILSDIRSKNQNLGSGDGSFTEKTWKKLSTCISTIANLDYEIEEFLEAVEESETGDEK